jgi:hypothetical protein
MSSQGCSRRWMRTGDEARACVLPRNVSHPVVLWNRRRAAGLTPHSLTVSSHFPGIVQVAKVGVPDQAHGSRDAKPVEPRLLTV